MSIPFTLDIAVQPQQKDIKWVAAGDWAKFDDTIFGLEQGDILEQAALTVKLQDTDADDAATSVQRVVSTVASANGQITNNNRIEIYFQPSDTEKMVSSHLYDLQIWVRRGANLYVRTVQRGRIYARQDITNSVTLLDPMTTLVITNGASASGNAGTTLQLVAEVRDGQGDLHPEYNPVWTTSNGAVATVDATGLVRFWGAGTCVITATLSSFGLADSINITTNGANMLAAVNGDVLTYDGSVWNPANPLTRAYTWTNTHIFNGSATFNGTTVVNALLTVNGNGVFNGGSDASTVVQIGAGGAAPTALRTAGITLNAPSSGSFYGKAAITMSLNSGAVWTAGIDSIVADTKAGVGDYGWYNHTSGLYVASLSSAGIFTTASIMAIRADGNDSIGAGFRLRNVANTQVFNIQLMATGNAMASWTYSTADGLGWAARGFNMLPTGHIQFTGSVGVGDSPSTTSGIQVSNTALTGAAQRGVSARPIFSSAATSEGASLYAYFQTAASAFTMTSGYGVQVDTPSIGATSAVASLYGVYVKNQGAAGVTNAYGIYIAAQSGAATQNIGLYTAGQILNAVTGNSGYQHNTSAAGQIYLGASGGVATLGTLNDFDFKFIRNGVTQINLSSAGTQHFVNIGIAVAPLANVGIRNGVALTATGGAAQAYLSSGQLTTAANSDVLAGLQVFNSFNNVGGFTNVSTMQIYIPTQTMAGAFGYGIYIGTISGAGANYGIRNTSSSWLAGNVGVGSVAPVADRMLQVRGTGTTAVGGSSYGILSAVTFDIGATTGATGIYSQVMTTAAVYTVTNGYGFYADVPSLGAGSTITSMFGVNVQNQGKAGITNAYGVYIVAQSGASSTNMGLYNAGTTKLADTVAIGANATPQGYIALSIGAGTGMLSGTDQYGLISNVTFTSSATTSGVALYGRVLTAASAFTLASGYGLQIVGPSVGSGSAITTMYGINVGNQGASGVTDAYGIYIAAQSGAATTNMGLFNAGTTRLHGNVSFGSLAPSSAYGLVLYGSGLLGGTSQYNVNAQMTFTSAATVLGSVISAAIVTAASAFTMTTASSFRAETPVYGAGSSVTTAYGLYVANHGAAAVTNAYGVYIASQSGANSLNIGLYNAGNTQLSGPVGIGIAPATNLGLRINGSVMTTGASQYAMYLDPTPTAAATEYGVMSIYARTSNATTLTAGYSIFIGSPIIGTTNTITTMYGILVSNQGNASTTNAYGIYIAAQSGAVTNNIGIYNLGTSRFDGTIGFGIAPTGAVALYVRNNNLTGTGQTAVASDAEFTSASTGSATALYLRVRTASAAYSTTTAYGINVDPPSLANTAVTTMYGVYVGNQGNAKVTHAYGVYIVAPTGAATTNLALYNGGDSQLQGVVGVGGGADASVAVYIRNSSLTTTAQVALGSYPVFNSAAAGGAGYAVLGRVQTQAAVFTLAQGYAFYAATPVIGAGSAITTQRGLYVANQGATGVTNAYGVYIEAPTGAATTNVGLYNAGTSMFIGNVSIGGGGISPQTYYGAVIRPSLTGSINQVGVDIEPTFGSGSTNSGAAMFAMVTTAAAAFTMVSGYGVWVGSPSLGAGSAITTNYGINVANQGATGVTNAYGVYIAAQSGASSVNIGLYNIGFTRLDSALAFGAAPAGNNGLNMASSFTVTAGSAIAYGAVISPTMVASANGDALYTLRIDSNSTPGAFTGLTRRGIQVAAFSVAGFTSPADPVGVGVDVVTGTGATNAYAILLSPPTGASNNYLIAHTSASTFNVKSDGAITAAAALTINATGSAFSAGTDANTIVTIGSGGASPTTSRAVELVLNSPHSVTNIGGAVVRFQRNGTTGRWTVGIDGAITGAKAADTDFYFHNATTGAYVAALSAAGTLTLAGGALSQHATVGIGYATGAGGAVTQITSRTTGVTLNKVTGAITLVSAAGSATYQSFTVTNSTVAATDVIRVVQKSGADLYEIHVTNVAAGSFQITYRTTGGTTTEQPVFSFVVLKGVVA